MQQSEGHSQCVCVCGHQTSSSVTSLLGKGYEGSDARSGQPAAVTEALLCVSIHPSINQSVAHSMRSQVTGSRLAVKLHYTSIHLSAALEHRTLPLQDHAAISCLRQHQLQNTRGRCSECDGTT